MEKIVLIGSGGHCRVVIDALQTANKYEIAAVFGSKEQVGASIAGIPIQADSELEDYFSRDVKFCFIAAGSTGNPHLRIKLFNFAERIGFEFPNIIHPGAIISPGVKMGRGNYVAPGVVINTGTIISDHCIINSGAVVDHDCELGDFVHIAPGVALSGGVQIGDNTHIGVGSSVIQNLKIGANSVIGAGSVVQRSMDENIVAYGVPCQKIRVHSE